MADCKGCMVVASGYRRGSYGSSMKTYLKHEGRWGDNPTRIYSHLTLTTAEGTCTSNVIVPDVIQVKDLFHLRFQSNKGASKPAVLIRRNDTFQRLQEPEEFVGKYLLCVTVCHGLARKSFQGKPTRLLHENVDALKLR